MRKNIIQGVLGGVLVLALVFLAVGPSLADSLGVSFESPTYITGTVNGQDGWTSLGSEGSGCAVYDHAVVTNTYGILSFEDQSLRISNAFTSGCFGDQTFAKPLTDSVGEVDATVGSFSEGTRQRHFEMQFDIASTSSGVQPGLFVSVSPDRGDGSRMSYLGFKDTEDGIDIIFYDVQGTDNPANFVPTELGTFSRATPHTIKLTMDTLDGPSNDKVKVWIDGNLEHTGTSWENYYRHDNEASAEQSPRIVKTVIFRTGGPAAPDTVGNGYLFDNLTLLSGPIPVGPPSNKNECKAGGWMAFNSPPFKNQGACVSYVQSNENAGKRD